MLSFLQIKISCIIKIGIAYFFLLEQEAIRNYVYVSGTNIFNMIKTMFIIYKMNLLEPET